MVKSERHSYNRQIDRRKVIAMICVTKRDLIQQKTRRKHHRWKLKNTEKLLCITTLYHWAVNTQQTSKKQQKNDLSVKLIISAAIAG